MEKYRCPWCDFEGWGVFRRGTKLFKLKPGDVSGCRNCGMLRVWDEDGSLRELTKQEFKKLRSDPEMWKFTVETMADTLKFLKKDLKEGGGE